MCVCVYMNKNHMIDHASTHPKAGQRQRTLCEYMFPPAGHESEKTTKQTPVTGPPPSPWSRPPGTKSLGSDVEMPQLPQGPCDFRHFHSRAAILRIPGHDLHTSLSQKRSESERERERILGESSNSDHPHLIAMILRRSGAQLLKPVMRVPRCDSCIRQSGGTKGRHVTG